MKTTLLVVGAVTKVAILPQQPGTKRMRLYQHDGTLQNINFYAPTGGDAPVIRPAGALIELSTESPRREFPIGVVIGWVLSASGSLNIAQEEYP